MGNKKKQGLDINMIKTLYIYAEKKTTANIEI